MATRNVHTEKSRDETSVDNVDTDGNGDVTVTFDGLRRIHSTADVNISAEGGYVANPQSVNGNQVTVRIFQGGGADTELAAVTNGADVTNIAGNALGE